MTGRNENVLHWRFGVEIHLIQNELYEIFVGSFICQILPNSLSDTDAISQASAQLDGVFKHNELCKDPLILGSFY